MKFKRSIPSGCDALTGVVPVAVWDPFVRSLHWAIALLVAVSWVTAENGWLGWHKLSGYSMLSCVLFRIYWGFCGGSTARFASFLCSPKVVARYLQTMFDREGERKAFLGHNPAGGWNVIALLAVLLVQICTGLLSVDVDGLESGPLARYVTFETARKMAGLHEIVFDGLLLLVGLHVVAVVAYLVYKRQNLIGPMVTGIKHVPRAQAQMARFVTPWRGWVGVALGILLILALRSL